MKTAEKFARRLCWRGFVPGAETGTTEARYWRELPEEKRQEYRWEARVFLYHLSRFAGDQYGKDLMEAALIVSTAAPDDSKARALTASHKNHDPL